MRFLTSKRVISGASILLIVLVIFALAVWFLVGPASDFSKQQPIAGMPPGSTIDAGCEAVYQRLKTKGFRSLYIEAQSNFKMEKALYISGKEARNTYKTDTNIQEDSRVCYVLISGNIEVSSQNTRKVQIYPTATVFYDPESLSLLSVTSSPI